MRMAALKLETLEDLFIHDLQDLYSAEKMIIDALPKMINGASSPQLKESFQNHLEQTRQQASRLESVFEMLDIEPEAPGCEGMEGIIKEGEKILSAEGSPSVKDAALIGAAQKVEHYEISGYGTARTYAQTLGFNDIAQMLQTTLKQESHTDELLTQIAEHSINREAAES